MTAVRSVLISMTALAGGLAVTACGGEPPEDPEASPYAGGPAQAEAEDAAAPQADADRDGETLEPLEVAAREVCAAGDAGFAAELPEGAAFASRGPDARVHAAWNEGGMTYETIIHTPSLDADAKLAFDGAVADFLRHNMVAGFDRTGLTGAFRYRDGRFCVVQTESEVIAPFQDAVNEAKAALEGSAG